MEWYVILEDQKFGPYKAQQISKMLREGKISLDTFVVRGRSPLRRKLCDAADELLSLAARDETRHLGKKFGSSSSNKVRHVARSASLRNHSQQPSSLLPESFSHELSFAQQQETKIGTPPSSSPRLRQSLVGVRSLGGRGRSPESLFPARSYAKDIPPTRQPIKAKVENARGTLEAIDQGAQGWRNADIAERKKRLAAIEEKKASLLKMHEEKTRAELGKRKPVENQVSHARVPEHQKPKVESEAEIHTAEKVRWKSGRVNTTSSRDAFFGAVSQGAPNSAQRAAKNLFTAANRVKKHGAGLVKSLVPRRVARSDRERGRRQANKFPLAYWVVGLAGFVVVVTLFLAIVRLRDKAQKSLMKQQEIERQAAEYAAQTSAKMEKAREISMLQEQKIARQKQLLYERRQKLREANKRSQEAKKGDLSTRNNDLQSRNSESGNGGKKSQQAGMQKNAAAQAAKSSSAFQNKRNLTKSASQQSTARRHSIPGWPVLTALTIADLRGRNFQPVTLLRISVIALPKQGCAPCQAVGRLSDGSVVTMVAPSFLPFLPAVMARASLVAARGVVQSVSSGGSKIMVQSVIRQP